MNERDGVERQADGWPVGVDDAMKATLTATVKHTLTYRGAMPTSTLLALVKAVRTGWDAGVLLDYQYATIERAALAAGGEKVWRISSV